MIQEGGPAGYTIIEVMVFLAITAVLFLAAITAIGGHQAQVQFSQGTRDTQSKIEEVINQVASDSYPNTQDFSCTVASPSSPLSPPLINPGGDVQGTSNKCIFLGKVLQFTTSGGAAGAVDYRLLSVAGRRTNSTGQEVTSLQEALPTPIDSFGQIGPNVTEKNILQFGIKVTRIIAPALPSSNGVYPALANNNKYYDTIAFFSSLAKFDANTGSLASGAQHVSFGVVPPQIVGAIGVNTENTAMSNIINLTDQIPTPVGKNLIKMNPPYGIVICLADQQNKEKAMLTIGGNASQTSVALSGDATYSTVICP